MVARDNAAVRARCCTRSLPMRIRSALMIPLRPFQQQARCTARCTDGHTTTTAKRPTTNQLPASETLFFFGTSWHLLLELCQRLVTELARLSVSNQRVPNQCNRGSYDEHPQEHLDTQQARAEGLAVVLGWRRRTTTIGKKKTKRERCMQSVLHARVRVVLTCCTT